VTQTILDIPGSNDILVGGFNPSEKYEISWDDYSQYMEKYNSCSKPPTSCCMSMVSGDCAQPSVSSVSSVGM
jgi:hypothetical protein